MLITKYGKGQGGNSNDLPKSSWKYHAIKSMVQAINPISIKVGKLGKLWGVTMFSPACGVLEGYPASKLPHLCTPYIVEFSYGSHNSEAINSAWRKRLHSGADHKLTHEKSESEYDSLYQVLAAWPQSLFTTNPVGTASNTSGLQFTLGELIHNCQEKQQRNIKTVCIKDAHVKHWTFTTTQ